MKQLASEANTHSSLCMSQMINVWHGHNASGNSPDLTVCFLALSPNPKARLFLLCICFLLEEIFFKATVPSWILVKKKKIKRERKRKNLPGRILSCDVAAAGEESFLAAGLLFGGVCGLRTRA